MAAITERLSQYCRSLRYEDLPTEVVHEVRRRVIDSISLCFWGLHCRAMQNRKTGGTVGESFIRSHSVGDNPQDPAGPCHLCQLAQGTIAVRGVFNALTAMLVEHVGFQAVYVSGGGLSTSARYLDEELLGLAEFVQQARYVAAAVSIPVICDADRGFGETLNMLRTVREFEAAGVAAIHIEDQELPKRCGHLEGKKVIEADVMAQKVRAAIGARTGILTS